MNHDMSVLSIRKATITLEEEMTDAGKASTPGYHLTEIPRGVYGESSKLMEEVLEIQDAEQQGAKLMVLIEMSDLVGAIKGYLKDKYPGWTITDLEHMADITDRAFENGHRVAK